MSRLRQYQHSKARRTLIVKKKVRPLVVDRLTFMAAIVEPFFTVPQVYQIFHYKTATGVSITAWLGFDILTVIWVWYALTHKDKMILLYQGLFFVANTFVIAGAIIYGGRWF